jgi:signal transduction histidine kinase
VSGSRLPRLRLAQWFGISAGLLLAVALVGVALGLASLHRLTDARELLIDRLDPATTSTERLTAAMLSEETAVRGYLLTGREQFLAPWFTGRRDQAGARRDLDRVAAGGGERLRTDLAALDAAIAAWTDGYALPTITSVRRHCRAAAGDAALDAGKERFDRIRASLDGLARHLAASRVAARERLSHAADTVQLVFVGFGVLLLLAVVISLGILRTVAIRPLNELVRQVRRVSRGEFDRSVSVDAAREIVQLGADIDSMRRRILAEAEDLKRSNAELEQFAYVASHDLQEPLRKVASFCQLLQSRYGGQLDERADQYIGFAVDGAKRMQELINDLLAFSRVGRAGAPGRDVDLGAVVRAAEGNLAERIQESGATVEVGELPTVRGDSGLLTLVFQNLIGNAIKFRGEDPPLVRIEARTDGDGGPWELTVADNGIGIEGEYADRIFVIFQRLHSRATYEGTGIGLAMVRKIVEHHGGRVWLEPGTERPGSTFRITLPRNTEDLPA